MKIKKANVKTYQNFLDRIHYNAEETEPEMVVELLTKIKGLLTNPFCLPHAVFAIDYQKNQYIFWDNNDTLGGYKSEFMLESGPQVAQKIVDASYFRTYSEILFPKLLETVKVQDNSVFMSFNLKVKQANGNPMHLYQKGVYIVSPTTRLPLMCIGLNMDISEFKTDSYINSTIETFDPVTKQMAVINKFCFNTLVDDVKLTTCEIRILNYLSEGLSSKLIADKLKISINTINNHRQNILRKTNCRNVAELIAFASNAGIK